MKRSIGLSLILCGMAPALFADDAQAMRDDLAARIKATQQEANCPKMYDLFYTQKADSDRLKAFEKTIHDYLCVNMNRQIVSIAFQALPPDKIKQPQDFEGKHSVYTLDPLGAVVIDYGNTGMGELKSISFMYGSNDDKYYLITTKNADAK